MDDTIINRWWYRLEYWRIHWQLNNITISDIVIIVWLACVLQLSCACGQGDIPETPRQRVVRHSSPILSPLCALFLWLWVKPTCSLCSLSSAISNFTVKRIFLEYKYKRAYLLEIDTWRCQSGTYNTVCLIHV